jgi:hypothetical protein
MANTYTVRGELAVRPGGSVGALLGRITDLAPTQQRVVAQVAQSLRSHSTLGEDLLSVGFEYGFSSATRANTLYNLLAVEMDLPGGPVGWISQHVCVHALGETAGAYSCKDDPRAEYREKRT